MLLRCIFGSGIGAAAAAVVREGFRRQSQARLCAFGGFRHQCRDPDFGKCRCCLSMKHTRQDLKIMQGWSLERKIRVTQTRIMEWYMRYDGQVFISFSGGKDSTVLLDLARRVYHPFSFLEPGGRSLFDFHNHLKTEKAAPQDCFSVWQYQFFQMSILRTKQKIRYVHCLDSLIVPTGKFVCCENKFGIIVGYFKQAVIFSLFCLF